MKLIAPLLEGLRQRDTYAASLVTKKTQQANSGPAQRKWRIEVSSYVRGSKTYREPRDQKHPRPNNLAWADVEVELRHPVVSGGHDQKAHGDQPSRIHLEANQAPDDRHR